MRLMHNLESLNVFREHSKVISRQSKAVESISSGYKINSSKDNPNGMASSEKMRIQIRGLQMAQRNAQDGVSMLQTADGALDNVTSMLQRVRQLTIQSGGAVTEEDKQTIQTEINDIIEGMDEIVNNTEFNGIKLMNGSQTKNLLMPVGANVKESITINVYNLNSSELKDINGDSLSSLNTKVSVDGGINKLGIDKSLSIIDGALNKVIQVRSKYGALENRFSSTYEKIGEIHGSIVGAESKVRDADIAEEMMKYTRDNLLIDSGHAMMVQSNKMPQEILRILENVRSR